MNWFPAGGPADGGVPWWYAVTVAAAVVMGVFFWGRMARRDARLPLIYLAGLTAGLIGAKAVYWLAEGWFDFISGSPWTGLLGGKSILGGLAGGYAGVELAKWRLGYTQATGDLFALTTPVGVVCGRLGCLLHGCCLGQPCSSPTWYTVTDLSGVARWPAVPLEIMFNLLFLATVMVLRRADALRGQRFHLYLISYACFRVIHELARDTPRLAGPFSGYSLVALGLGGFGVWAWRRRAAVDCARSAGGNPIT
jgi:phosphatidylglycerol:prolipoprotein diacylglycerol transferase